MNWEELKEKAKELGYKVVKKEAYGKEQECFVNEEGIGFYKDGSLEWDCDYGELCGYPFTYNRTPDQMYDIMKALQ